MTTGGSKVILNSINSWPMSRRIIAEFIEKSYQLAVFSRQLTKYI
jgi:hypothetical protein